MTNAQILTGLTARNVARIEADMERGYSFAEALARAKAASIAGPAVWQAVEAHFAGIAEDIGYEAAPAFLYTPCFNGWVAA